MLDSSVEALSIDLSQENSIALPFPLDLSSKDIFHGFEGNVRMHSGIYYPGSGAFHVEYAYKGSIQQPLRFARYPFDRHALILRLNPNPDFTALSGAHIKFVAVPNSRMEKAEMVEKDKLARAFRCCLGASVVGQWKKGPEAAAVRAVDFSGKTPRYVVLFERQRSKLLVSAVAPGFLQSSFSLAAFAVPCNLRFEQLIVALLPLVVLSSRGMAYAEAPQVATVLDYYWFGLQLLPVFVAVVTLSISLGVDPVELGDASQFVYAGSTAGILVTIAWLLINAICAAFVLSNRLTINWHEVMAVSEKSCIEGNQRHRTAKVQSSPKKKEEKPVGGVAEVLANVAGDKKEKELSALEKSVIMDRLETA